MGRSIIGCTSMSNKVEREQCPECECAVDDHQSAHGEHDDLPEAARQVVALVHERDEPRKLQLEADAVMQHGGQTRS